MQEDSLPSLQGTADVVGAPEWKKEQPKHPPKSIKSGGTKVRDDGNVQG
jgi:hypothetical protein